MTKGLFMARLNRAMDHSPHLGLKRLQGLGPVVREADRGIYKTIWVGVEFEPKWIA